MDRKKGKKDNFKPKGKPRFKSKRTDKSQSETPSKEGVRLNKYLANAGLCSRREADTYIESGVVKVNGKVITELGYRVQPGDNVHFGDEKISSDKMTYLVMNKPKGFTCMTPSRDVQKTVYDLIQSTVNYPMKAISWLDRPSTGVLLLTNDLNMEKKLANPNLKIKSIFKVVLNKSLTAADLKALRDGVMLEEGKALLDRVEYVEGGNKNEVGIETHLNWDKLIKRIFNSLEYEVIGLDRVSYAGLSKKNLSRGQYRKLTDLEINRLKILN